MAESRVLSMLQGVTHMLSRSAGCGSTTALVNAVGRVGGLLICHSAHEAKRVHREHGIDTVSMGSTYLSACGLDRSRLILLDNSAAYRALTSASSEILRLRRVIETLNDTLRGNGDKTAAMMLAERTLLR